MSTGDNEHVLAEAKKGTASNDWVTYTRVCDIGLWLCVFLNIGQ